MLIQRLFSLIFSLVGPLFAQDDYPTVITKYGAISGSYQRTADGTLINEFLGIPFAQPPVGKLRFEKPKSPIPWTKPLNTTVFSKGCTPCRRDDTTFGEDCLYLNVWTSNLTGNQPVLVFIHGGAYIQGNAYSHPADKWREVWARRDIVAVTIQYRLGPFGFLTLNDSKIAPNLGLWDQNMALRWIQENIERFGGDSKRVTIYGESAGSSSVAQHTISPRAKDLFSRAIEMSGSVMASFGRGLNTIDYSRGYIQALGCSNSSDYKACLQSKTEKDILDVDIGWKDSCGPSALNWLGFAPILDGDYLPLNILESLRTVPKVPTIMGINQKEARLFTIETTDLPISWDESRWDQANSSTIRDYIRDWIVNIGYTDEERPRAEDEIFAYLAKNHTDERDYYFWLDRYVLSYSDFMMNVPIIREAVEKTKAGVPVYAFTFAHSNPAQWPEDLPAQGSTHVGEYPWILEFHLNFNYTDDDIVVKDLIQNLFIQFCKIGDPSIPEMKWNRFTSTDSEYLSVSPKTQMLLDWFGESYRFWTETMSNYSYDYVSQSNWNY